MADFDPSMLLQLMKPQSDGPDQAMVADALRQKEQLGMLAQLSGNQTAAPFAQSVLKGVSDDRDQQAASQQQAAQQRVTLAQAYQNALAKKVSEEREQAGLDERVRHDKEMEQYSKAYRRGGHAGSAGGGVPGLQLSEDALDDFASQFHNTGQMPPGLGMGKTASDLKIKIANRAAERFGKTDLAGAKAGYGADTKSLAAQQRQADSVEAFENTAGKNLDTFLEQAGKVADSGSPLFNAPGRKFQDMVEGNPQMAAFKAARQTAVSEIGKVLSGTVGGGALSDSARKEVEELIGPDASLAQIKSAAEILKRDMANRKVAVSAQLQATRGRMSGRPAQPEAAPDATVQPGEVVMLDPKGKPHAVPEDQVKAAEEHHWRRK